MRKKLVVVQIVPALNNGGVERGTIEVANYLANKGHTSIIISSGGAMLNKLSKKVEHVQMEVGKKSLSSLFLIKKLRTYFSEIKANIVHVRSRLPAWLAYKAISAMDKDRPKFITTIHGLYSVKTYSSIMARGDKVIAVSQTALDYVNDNYSAHLKLEPCLIYRGIDPHEFPYAYDADFLWLQKWYEKHHQLVGYKTVLIPGRLTSLKGIQELEYWLLNDENDAKLVLTANPENELYAAKLYHWFKDLGVENKVIWVGVQPLMAELYSVVDVVVSTSIRPESFGRTILEALSIGKPVIAYNHGGVGEILSAMFPQGRVIPNNQKQLCQTINSILKNAPVVKKKAPFLLSDMLLQTEELYYEVLNA